MTLALETRPGWPQDLRFLIEQYPREGWQAHANLGAMARFWLQRHDMFRDLGGSMQKATGEFRSGILTPSDFQRWFAPRLQFFLSNLHAHHHIEDFHYFPIFRAAEQRLVRGFETLEGDHESIHASIVTAVGAANALLEAMAGDADAMRRTGDRYAAESEKLLAKLLRHLEDEEDLIVPLILDRGEDQLGVG